MSKKFVGFYLHFRKHRQALEYTICQFYRQMIGALRLYNNEDYQLFIDNEHRTAVPEYMDERIPGVVCTKESAESSDDFVLFRGDFMKVFDDGVMIYGILKESMRLLGQNFQAIIEVKRERYRLAGRHGASMRAVCSYVDNNFLSQLPSEYQVAFAVDCLLYSEWQIRHRNLIGLHMVVVAWMLGVKQFDRFIPDGLRSCPALTSPILRTTLPLLPLELRFDEQEKVATKPSSTVSKRKEVPASTK